MAKNSLGRGEILSLIAPSGGVVSGVAVQIGDKLVIPVTTAAEGELVACALEEIFRLPKTTGQAYAQLKRVYWDNSGHKLTSVAAGNMFAGITIKAAASDDAFAEVLLADCCAETGDANAAIAAVVEAVSATGGGAGNAGKLVKLDGDGKLDGLVVADLGTTLGKYKRGTVAIAMGDPSGTAAMGAGTWDGKPVQATLQSAAGAIAASVPMVKAVIAGGTLTVSLVDKDGAPVNAGSALVFSFAADAN